MECSIWLVHGGDFFKWKCADTMLQIVAMCHHDERFSAPLRFLLEKKVDDQN